MSYVDFAKICYVINKFPELNHNFVKECIVFPIIYNSRAIKWRKCFDELQTYVDQIDTKTYHDFTIDLKTWLRLYFLPEEMK